MSDTLPLRVTVLDTWDEVALDLPATTAVGELKAQALAASRVTRPAVEYQVKYLGAELSEDASLADAGVVANGALIVLSRRRRPAL